ncbi:MAG: transposase [Pirellulaceae bacterium]|nr:transposase [Pirellulaceae bacterium]
MTLVTSLLDPVRDPQAALAEAYGLRWTIETAFGHLKTTMKMDVLRCQTVRGIETELTMFHLVFNLVRMTVLEAAQRQGVPPERISFVDALRWLATAQPGEELPELVINPSRPGGVEPRVRKRRPKEFTLMKSFSPCCDKNCWGQQVVRGVPGGIRSKIKIKIKCRSLSLSLPCLSQLSPSASFNGGVSAVNGHFAPN